jgi:cytochrome b6-f complex iron-sulfur subunit
VSNPSRRQFLEALSVSAIALAQGCTNGGPLDGTVTATGGVAQLTFAQFPALTSVGGGVVVGTQPGPIVVVRTGESTAIALSAVCTHAGCRVEYSSGSNIICPCHGSEFTLTGAVIAGPASQPLQSYPTTVDMNGINVMVA